MVESSGSPVAGGPTRRVGARPTSPSGDPRVAPPGVGRLNAPRPALVEAGPGGTPHRVNREQVTLVREEWRVVDRWWTDEPVDRHYFEVVLEGGRNVCVYRDAEACCWFTQNA